MSKTEDFLSEIKKMLVTTTKVCICNTETKKYIEDRIEMSPDIVLIGTNHVEKNVLYVVENEELKKTLLEGYWIGKKQMEGSEENASKT